MRWSQLVCIFLKKDATWLSYSKLGLNKGIQNILLGLKKTLLWFLAMEFDDAWDKWHCYVLKYCQGDLRDMRKKMY